MRFLIGLLLLALPLASSHGQEGIPLSPTAAKAIVDSISREYYESKFAMYPAYATSKGIHTYDSELSTFGPLKVRKFLIQTKSMIRTVSSFSEDSLDIETWIDMKALLSDMETQAFLFEELEMWRRSPLLYAYACTDGLYSLVIRNGRFWSDPNFSARLSQVPRVLEQARKNLLRPMKLHCDIASASIEAFLPFLKGLGDSTGAAGAALDTALVARACESLEQFRAYLDSLSVTADANFALGYENFVKLLKVQHMMEEPPEEILAYAVRVLKDAKSRQAASTPLKKTDRADTTGALGLTKNGILADFRAEAESAMVYLERKAIVTVPRNTEVVPVETPGFIKVVVPGYAYEPPGPFDDDQRGLLYVPLPDSLDLEAKLKYKQTIDQRGFKGIVVHELYPGHHLQLTLANAAPSFVKRLAEDNFTIEGWALYCEEIMAEQGYYGPEGTRRALRGIIFRAARVIVDIKLQLREFSLDQAVDFMVSETGSDRHFVEQEVRRYAVEPTQPMSYLIGKRDIMSLREEFRRLRGEQFSLREFHDTLLSRGSLPPYLLKISVISKVIGRQ